MEKIMISERLHYETYALGDLLARMKKSDDDELNDFWLNKYIETYKEYSLAKQELEKEYIIPKFGNNISWNLDFKTREVNIKEE